MRNNWDLRGRTGLMGALAFALAAVLACSPWGIVHAQWTKKKGKDAVGSKRALPEHTSPYGLTQDQKVCPSPLPGTSEDEAAITDRQIAVGGCAAVGPWGCPPGFLGF